VTSTATAGRTWLAMIAVTALLLSLLHPMAATADDMAPASSEAPVVISQVYGGGGNTGATLKNDFIELHNRSDAPVSLSGWSVQYASSAGTTWNNRTNLSGSIAPGGYYLIQQAAGAGGTEDLPAPDAVGNINMALGAGKVALVSDTAALAGSCPLGGAVVDFVGYGTAANCYEGSGPTATLTNTTAAIRKDGGAQDTDDNAADFETGTPAPRNSSFGEPAAAAVVVSQVYGGGGNSGATYTHDFIELRNRTSAPVSLAGWSVQYASATGSTWQVTALSGSVPADGYYLIQQAAGAGGTTPLPTPDATGGIPMAATAGKVALVSTTTALSGTCPTGGAIVDFVGFGTTANCFEGSGPTPAPSNTTAVLRRDGGLLDTDDNATDFVTGAPLPRNSGQVQDPDPDPVDLCEVADADLTMINEIQGPGAATPIPGQAVITRGVVTADFTSGPLATSPIPANQGLRGFFIEAITADRDTDPQTSEGVFVFDGGAVFDGDIGDLVHVAGTPGEFGDVTQVTVTDLAVCADTGVDTTLPPPAELPLPVAPADRASVLEPLESMRVTHAELTVVEFFQLERFGEVRLSSGGVLQNPTNVVDPRDDEAYNAIVAYNAANNIILDDGRSGQNLARMGEDVDPLPYVEPGDTLRIGDQLRDHAAVLHFGFGAWRLQPIDVDAITEQFQTNRTRPRPQSPPDVGGSLTVASFNVLNYFNGEPNGTFPTTRGAVTASEFERQTDKIVDAIVRFDADIVGLIEIENDEGPGQATQALVGSINDRLEADVYAFVDTGRIGTDEIKMAYIYKPEAVEATGDYAILDSSVDPRFEDQRSRPVLTQTFTELATGEAVTVSVNHLKSKGSACLPEDNDPRQGNCNGVRLRAAEAMADWLATDPTGQDAAGHLIIGDLNAYAKEDPIRALQDAGYTDLLELFAPADTMPYTYTFDATQGYLDHALAEEPLLPHVEGAAAWNINADEVPAIDYQESIGVPGNARFRHPAVAAAYYEPHAFRSSDHDPVLIGLDLRPFPPTDMDQCKLDGWERDYRDVSFRNQGQCVAYVVANPRAGLQFD
jgi:predicted extracellular nuclease